MSDIVIFGTLDTAQLAHFYLTHDSEHRVVAFTVHERYIQESSFCGLPVVPFETLEQHFPPDQCHFFAPMTGKKMNTIRQAIYEEGKSRGYPFISYISSRATVFSESIGENCFILEDNTLQPFTRVGNNVVLWSGNHIGHHSHIADHVFFTSHVVLSGHCQVDSFSFFGVNATVRDSVHIAEGTFVAMSACVGKPTEAWGVYTGNPAEKRNRIKSIDIY